jgi:uncharacterized membrane protein
MIAKAFLTEADRAAVEAAIAEAESRTGAEIVCAVATESGRYDRAEAIVGLVASLLGLGVVELAAAALAPAGAWEGVRPALWLQSLAVVGGWIGGTVLASYCHPLRRLFCSRAEMEAETGRAAAQVFVGQRLHASAHGGAVLLYFSLFERCLVVMPNEKATAVAGEGLAAEVRDIATRELAAGARAGAITAALRPIADRLAAAYPAPADNPDTHPNRVLLYHPRP